MERCFCESIQWTKKLIPANDSKVDSRIIIDFQGFNWNNPSCRTVLSKIITSAGEAQIGLISDDYVICNNWIPGFALSHKKWYLFNIDLLEEIEFHTTAFESLVLAPERKEFLSSLVEHHIKPKNTHELDDIIEGKGRGLNILLSGAPGLGKTLTAGTLTVLLIKQHDDLTLIRNHRRAYTSTLACIVFWRCRPGT
jgi:hypothetical protein